MSLRQPTPDQVLYAWHRDALGPRALPIEDEPQCGWFKVKLNRHAGWASPARVFIEREIDPLTGELVVDERLALEINTRRYDPVRWWERLREHPITKAEYEYLMALAVWAAWHQPNHPAASPRQPIDWLHSPPPRFKKTVTMPATRHRRRRRDPIAVTQIPSSSSLDHRR